ncbi:hypothetical protein ALI22I_10795 [Saccharothrix sp. ALI-22-I]|uniref:alanine racemase n=1 Tax=Saccharothrix sp. ALI-22-I TaxID=1933778 RepID=UPI00097BE532|nr:alanine racemase [Saccharothrix sp. ALI-22-I]ONI90914.1 hypothetical protein ALI22I_10795 [Saccharothrix sp. ALI-22-I]
MTPYLLVDEAKVRRNVDRLRAHLDALGAPLRPHVKTAKSVDVARLVFDGGTGPITVSTLREAEAFADDGFTDIVYAVGIAPSKLDRVVAGHQVQPVRMIGGNQVKGGQRTLVVPRTRLLSRFRKSDLVRQPRNRAGGRRVAGRGGRAGHALNPRCRRTPPVVGSDMVAGSRPRMRWFTSERVLVSPVIRACSP